ncbi:LytTR family DNA-binding domain-containing protein [Myroides odoratimimus]|uniref:LytR/AlgR family response regulator transcription factor n=1 Tax=Myroides TaxID=76831 RepID=UPI002576E822|nr:MULTISPECIES: LytTR family DNA-binding domain-containing protein [Myroides]MDM1086697.1 response regulator transcription factor [Myroides odoratimimus]MDM1450446.1 response regulator transcription factor [Myroides odoratimimus]MDM1456674.1 response regulator transcription factor [Myroides odoratimimus]MDM1467326.1 response regulator transcription factor [Myroides odoratimimus]MDM1470616.1 response regulator transcription factor [Myroides odoratimimus]
MSIDKKNSPLKCLVVDDEPLARKAIIDYIAKIDFLTVEDSCASAIEALELIQDTSYDLLFLDINMPYLTGIEFLESIKQPPLVIFTTAYSEHALDGFRLQVVDYLLKPISFKRFYQATLKAKELFDLRNADQNETTNSIDSTVYVKHEDSFVKIDWKDIMYIEAMQNYLKLHLNHRCLIIHQTMIAIEELLPKEHFYRIHKSFLININHIESISGGRVFIKETELPISRMRKEALLNEVVYKNLLSK